MLIIFHFTKLLFTLIHILLLHSNEVFLMRFNDIPNGKEKKI